MNFYNRKFDTLLVTQEDKVLDIQLNSPKTKNSLSVKLVEELTLVLKNSEADQNIHCTILRGSEQYFISGGNLAEFKDQSFVEMFYKNAVESWEVVSRYKKPIIAAVNGYAIGGGCEIAMMCDIIIAGETSKFLQPEISLGIIPGAGGTQRLPRAIGKAKAMDICLTNTSLSAEEALNAGLISRLVPDSQVTQEAKIAAQKIAGYPLQAAMMMKSAIKKSYETSLEQGLEIERHYFYSLFSTEDQKNSMQAFLNKQKPKYQNK